MSVSLADFRESLKEEAALWTRGLFKGPDDLQTRVVTATPYEGLEFESKLSSLEFNFPIEWTAEQMAEFAMTCIMTSECTDGCTLLYGTIKFESFEPCIDPATIDRLPMTEPEKNACRALFKIIPNIGYQVLIRYWVVRSYLVDLCTTTSARVRGYAPPLPQDDVWEGMEAFTERSPFQSRT